MNDIIIYRGRGPEIRGTRITVYDIIHYLEHGHFSHAEIADILRLTSEEMQGALAYINEHRATLMPIHQEIEARIARGNSPDAEALLKDTSKRFQKFKEWLIATRETRHQQSSPNGSAEAPETPRKKLVDQFDEWLAFEEGKNGTGSEE